MAYSTINDPSAYFQTAIYTGTGGSRSVTNDGNSDLQPDWLWVKRRSATNSHHLVNSSMGLSGDVALASDLTNAQFATPVSAFNSDGFSFNAGDASVNANSSTYVAWNWKAGGTGSSNTDGSITSTVSANTTAGFSIVSYTGTGSAGTVGHGLSSAPSIIIIKVLTNTANDWVVYHQATGNNQSTFLNANNAVFSNAFINNTTPTSSVFSVDGSNYSSGSSRNYIAYCFAEKKGYSKFSSYQGSGNSNGPYIHLGFSPAWVMIKNTEGTDNWNIYDNKRLGYNTNYSFLIANEPNAENTTTSTANLDLLSSGFKIRSSTGHLNTSGDKYIFMAFAESPFTNSNGVPNNAR